MAIFVEVEEKGETQRKLDFKVIGTYFLGPEAGGIFVDYSSSGAGKVLEEQPI